MSCQILIKTAPHMQGHYSFLCEDHAARQAFADRGDVYWYAFPEDDEIVWRKGGAWNAAEPVPFPVTDGGRFEYEDTEDLRRAHLKPVSEEDDEDDERWLPVRRQAVRLVCRLQAHDRLGQHRRLAALQPGRLQRRPQLLRLLVRAPGPVQPGSQPGPGGRT